MEPVDVSPQERYGNVRGVSNLGAAISHNGAREVRSARKWKACVSEFASARIAVLPAVPRRSRIELLVVGTRAKPAPRSAIAYEHSEFLSRRCLSGLVARMNAEHLQLRNIA